MTDRPFRVIEGGGKPEPDPEIIEVLERALERARGGEFENILLVLDLGGESIPECYVRGDDELRAVNVAELMLHPAKMMALGYEPE